MRVGEPPSQHMASMEVVLVPSASERCFRATPSSLRVFTAGRAPEGLLRCLEALFPALHGAVGEPPHEPDGLPDCNLDLDLALEAGAHENNEYFLG